LEDRVRALEAEVRELKDLLDEKDEKIDMLSRIHSQSSQPILPSQRRPSTTSVESGDKEVGTPDKDEVFKVQQSPHLLTGSADGADTYFTGTSSGRTFIEAFKYKVQESGRSTADVNTDLLLSSSLQKASDPSSTPSPPIVYKTPPRMVSDQLINIFFQEWAPLFPVLHRPTFLTLYEKYVADSDAVTDKTAIAQLNLVFGIAALSNGARSSADLESFESQWKTAIDTILTENTMATLQALTLAQIFCLQQGDTTRLLTYKGLSTSLSARLGLHQSQKRFALGTLTCETRKKVFWTLYAVDCFTAVVLGLPKHIKDDDVHCEYPADADDEYVTERGFQPTLPGESTKLSSALALFRAARILSKVLEEVFPAKASYELSLKRLSELSDELEAWSSSLAPHLRLHFSQDKPSTGTISSRSPLLSLTYHYIRALIQRPAVCASLGSKSSSSMMVLANSCKHTVQIVQLLEERGMSFSFCLNKDEVLVLSGFGLLFQGLSLDPTSKLLRDNQKMIAAIIHALTKSKAPCAPEFSRVARSFLPTPPEKATQPNPTPALALKRSAPKHVAPPVSRHNSALDVTVNTSSSLPSSTRKQLKAIASRFSVSGLQKPPKLDAASDHRRATVHNLNLHPHGVPSQSQPCLQLSSDYDPASMSRSEPARSPSIMYTRPAAVHRPSAPPQPQPQLKPKQKPSLQKLLKQKPSLQKLPNLDYFAFSSEALPQPTSHPLKPVKPEPQPTDWEKLLGSLDNGMTNIYDACYGGQPIEALLDSPVLKVHHNKSNSVAAVDGENSTSWDAELWATLYQTDTSTSTGTGAPTSNGPDSVFSFSTDEGSSSGDYTNADWGSANNLNESDVYRGIVMPAESGHNDGLDWHTWDAGLNL